MTTRSGRQPVHVVLVPGFWLGAWAWEDVVPVIEAAGLVAHPVTLPGLDDVATDRRRITGDDQVAAVARLVDGLTGDVVLVGHSGGGPIVQQVTDRDPGRIRRVIYVDSGPLVDGASLDPTLAEDVVDLALPSWEQLTEQGSSIEGIDEAGLARFRARSVPTPAAVARTPVRVGDPRRLDVPATAICTSLPSQQLKQLANPGPPLHTELGQLHDLTYVDLPTGHWPMFSRPVGLGTAIVAAVVPDALAG